MVQTFTFWDWRRKWTITTPTKNLKFPSNPSTTITATTTNELLKTKVMMVKKLNYFYSREYWMEELGHLWYLTNQDVFLKRIMMYDAPYNKVFALSDNKRVGTLYILLSSHNMFSL